MKPYSEILQILDRYNEIGETKAATFFLINQYGIEHSNFKGFEIGERATNNLFLMTTEGVMGTPQIIKIPENTYDFPINMVLNLLAHEMIHVGQKSKENLILDKNEREWQAYYEMLFHKIFPLIPPASDYHQKFFAEKALEYYQKMGENSELQKKYDSQKKEVEKLLESLKNH